LSDDGNPHGLKPAEAAGGNIATLSDFPSPLSRLAGAIATLRATAAGGESRHRSAMRLEERIPGENAVAPAS